MVEKIIREGSWICPNCQTKNRGAKETCDACGAVRGNVQFLYEEDGQVVTDAAERAKATAGPDWICAFCGNSNAFDRPTCQSCSAARSEGTLRQVKEATVKGGEGLAKRQVSPHATVAPDVRIEPVKAPLPLWFKAGCVIAVLGLLALVGLQSLSFEDTMTVVGKEWRRAIQVMQYQTCREGGWRGELPAGAREIRRQEKIRSYRDVLIGYQTVEETYTERQQVGTRKVKKGVRDLGNGRFEEIWDDEPIYRDVQKTRTVQKPQYRKEPVYDTWIEFDIDRWKDIGPAVAQGTTDEPRWPETGAAAHPRDIVGEKREGAREESYKVTFKSDKDGKTYVVDKLGQQPLSYEAFRRLQPGDQHKVIISGLGLVKDIPGLQPSSR